MALRISPFVQVVILGPAEDDQHQKGNGRDTEHGIPSTAERFAHWPKVMVVEISSTVVPPQSLTRSSEPNAGPKEQHYST